MIAIYRGEQMRLKAFAVAKEIVLLDPTDAEARGEQSDLAAKLGITP